MSKPLLPTILCHRCETGKIKENLLSGNADTLLTDEDKGTCADAEFKSRQKVLVFEASSFGHDAWFTYGICNSLF